MKFRKCEVIYYGIMLPLKIERTVLKKIMTSNVSGRLTLCFNKDVSQTLKTVEKAIMATICGVELMDR